MISRLTRKRHIDKSEQFSRHVYAVLTEAKRKELREHLANAMNQQDMAALAEAIKEFERSGISDTSGDLDRAQKLLQFLQVSQGTNLCLRPTGLRLFL